MSDYMVDISTIEGDGTREGFVGAIVCESMRHAIELSVDAAQTNRTGGAASKHGMIELTHSIDKATPYLRLAAAKGTNLGQVTISRMGGTSNDVLDEVELENVFIGRIDMETMLDETTLEPGDQIRETFALLYTQIKWTYKEGGANLTGGWNLTTQTTV